MRREVRVHPEPAAAGSAVPQPLPWTSAGAARGVFFRVAVGAGGNLL